MNKLYIKYVGEKIKGYPHYNVPRQLELKAQEIVLKELALKDMGQLRDKFEGQAYYDKKFKIVFGASVAYQYFEKPLPSFEFISSNSDLLTISHKNQKYEIIVSETGLLPDFSTKKVKHPVVIVFSHSSTKGCIAGIAPKSILLDKTNYVFQGLRGKFFKGFSQLKMLK